MKAALPSVRPRRLRPMLTPLLTALGLYLLAAGVLAIFQRHLIYHPYRASSEELRALAAAGGLEPWRNAAGQRIGWCRRSGVRPAAAQLLVLHGNAGCAVHRAMYGPALQAAAAVDLFIVEYPGYGDRPGAPSEPALVAAGEEALGLLSTDAPVYLLGESLGSGVAAWLAGRHPERIAGVLLIAPFNNLASLAQSHMPIFPVRWMLRDRFESERHLAGYRGPLAVLLAGRDEVVPNKFGRALYEGYTGPKRLWETPEATHNEVYEQPAEFWRAVWAFWQEHRPGVSP